MRFKRILPGKDCVFFTHELYEKLVTELINVKSEENNGQALYSTPRICTE
jgi:hypothetical protein